VQSSGYRQQSEHLGPLDGDPITIFGSLSIGISLLDQLVEGYRSSHHTPAATNTLTRVNSTANMATSVQVIARWLW
jgi:hypothetical protein